MRHLLWCAILLGGACERTEPAPKGPPTREEIVVEDEWISLGRLPWKFSTEFGYLRELTWWQLHVLAPGEEVYPEVVVRLGRDGHLQIAEKDAWRSVSLDDFWRSASLDDFSRCLEQSSGICYDETDGRRASGIFVGIGVQRRASWLHLGWLLAVCMENHVYKTQIRVGARRLRLFLPWDAAIERTEPPPHVRVAVEVRADGYRVGKRKVDLDQVVQHLERVVRTTERPDLLVWAPVIADDVAVERAMELFAACLGKGIPRLDLALRIPRKEDRCVDPLRRPERDR
jgi:hypothetical protein